MNTRKFCSSAPMPAIPENVDVPPSKWHVTLVEMIDCIEYDFVAQGKTEDEARADAVIAVKAISKRFQKCMVYIPASKLAEIAMRRALIFAEFNGTNIDELAIKHDVSSAHIYRVIKQHRELMKKQ